MPNYMRYRVPGGCYFFTVNLLRRNQKLLVEHIDLLRESVRVTRKKAPFHIDAWVVLPDHMHCLWTLPPGDDDYSGRWRSIKKHFSKGLPKTEPISPTRQRRGERGIWQRRFWEHCIRNNADYTTHMDYIHHNPLKHGWVNRVADWPYSTFHKCVRKGIYPADWCGSDIATIDTGERH